MRNGYPLAVDRDVRLARGRFTVPPPFLVTAEVLRVVEVEREPALGFGEHIDDRPSLQALCRKIVRYLLFGTAR